jgi:hypothetical protein
MTKKAGSGSASGSRSIIQRHGSSDPDPDQHQNVNGSATLHFQSPKSLDFQGLPFLMALEMDLPTSNHYVPRHINNRYSTLTRPSKKVLPHNDGFFNTCTMKRCLHRKVNFKANALNNVNVSQRIITKQGCYKTTLLLYTWRAKQNS